MNSQLYRSPDDRIFAGVAGGMAEAYELDPALVRVGWALLILVSGGLFLILYIVMALVVPLRPQTRMLWSAAGAGAGGEAPVTPASAPGGVPAEPGAGPTQPRSTGYEPQAADPEPTPPPYYPPPVQRRRRDASGAVIFGLILIAVGGFFLLRQFVPTLDFSLIWPIVAIAAGVVLIAVALINRDNRA